MILLRLNNSTDIPAIMPDNGRNHQPRLGESGGKNNHNGELSAQ